MYRKAMIIIFAITTTIIFTASVNANNYECDKCNRRLKECWESQRGMKGIVSGSSMAATCTRMQNTCNRICSGNGSISGSGLGQFNPPNLSPQQVERETRKIELSLKIQRLLQPYRAKAHQKCVMMGQTMGAYPDRFCVMAVLMPLTDSSNVYKVMDYIGAKQNEADLVQTLILNYIMQ